MKLFGMNEYLKFNEYVKMQTMRYLPVISIYTLLLSCGDAASSGAGKLDKISIDADSMVVNYYTPARDSLLYSYSTTNRANIDKLLGYVQGKTTEVTKCGFDGDIELYKSRQMVMAIDFKMKDNICRHYSILLNNQAFNVAMTPEALQFMERMRRGQ